MSDHTHETVTPPVDASPATDLWAIEQDGQQVPALSQATAVRWAASFGGTATRWTGTPEAHKAATDEALAWADRFIEQHVITD